ncbi:hypothetical protein [Pseudomonas sp. GD04019]|uniref:hypothetical protein n=1 Tax=Pseudomonas sp. GD04019 TaxID=2975420 RepID=UPI00244C0C06|nr:hypothetical protein [Pseudomonas sp. GD04019]MDH0036841.1 hypothetical protein [Pseudomonas sp. GD04019]
MEISDALKMIDRINHLPEIYDQIEKSVLAVIYSYYNEILTVELDEAVIMNDDEYDDEELSRLIEQKKLIHAKYWSNLAGFYQSCSSSSEPDHVWSNFSEIEILQNGDEGNSLFLFKAKYKDQDSNLTTNRAYLLRLNGALLKIEHTFFG